MLFLALVVLRLANAFLIRTFFQPDEFFQSLEPAHALVYGYGYLTWEWREALRSALHPLVYAGAYKLALAVLPENLAVAVAPKVVGALIAATTDLYVYKFALAYWRRQSVARAALALSIASSWNWYVSTRAFSNNLETMLTAVALAAWPWHRFQLGQLLYACAFGVASCVVRPTNALLWGYLGTLVVAKNINYASRLGRLAVALAVVVALVLGASALADRLFYRRWTFPLWTFVEFNVVRNLLIFYGAAPWHFYIGQGVPLMLMGYLPFFVAALSASELVGATAFVVAAFSAIAHKEFRFLQPVYPIMLVLTARPVDQWLHKARKWPKVCAVSAVVVLHVCAAYFFTRVNEVGEISVVHYLRDTPDVSSVGFLTPCHSTPWHSTLHRPDLVANLWFLTCEPPLHLAQGTLDAVKAYRDELDQFFDDPIGFVQVKLADESARPSHLVIFEPMESVLGEFLHDARYTECRRFFNSYSHWDLRRCGDIIVYCRHEANGR